MKLWIPILVLAIGVFSLCWWDTFNTTKVFNTLAENSEKIHSSLQIDTIENKDIQEQIINLNDFWTKKMDTLSISISRKDLQPVSDYLQYLVASISNKNQEDAVTYANLLYYNVRGLQETNCFSFVNLL